MPSIAYEVTVTLGSESEADDFARWMQAEHIPAVMNTHCFESAEFGRLEATIFRTRYIAASRTHLDDYLRDHAAALRDHFAAEFGTTATSTRQNWEILRRWPAE